MTHDTEAGAVPPALTAAEWARVLAGEAIDPILSVEPPPDKTDRTPDGRPLGAIFHAIRHVESVQHRPEALVALANAARDDADPRKLTWAMVDRMREGADALLGEARDGSDEQRAAALRRDADAIEALLPPCEGA